MLHGLVKSSVSNSALWFSVALLAVVLVLAALAVCLVHRTCSEHMGCRPAQSKIEQAALADKFFASVSGR